MTVITICVYYTNYHCVIVFESQKVFCILFQTILTEAAICFTVVAMHLN